MRSPFTGVVFALELTHDVNALLPLLVSTVVAHGFTVLTLRRSILTEKVSRRGFHLSREYAVDPLEILFVREVMRTSYVAISANASGEDLPVGLRADGKEVVQRLFPVVDDDGRLVGVVTRSDLTHLAAASKDDATGTPVALASVVRRDSVVAYPDEPLRTAVYRMAETGLTRFPVVERATGSLVGMVSLADLLKARVRNLEAERRRGRVLQVQRLFPPWIRRVDEDREGIPVAPPAGREEVTGMSAPSDSIGSVDELSRLLVSDVLRSDHAVIPAATPVRSLLSELQWNGKLFGSISDGPDADRWWIVTGDDNRAIGIVTASQIVHAQAEISLVRGMVADLAAPVSYCLFPDETLREAVVRMIHADRSWLPVVERADPARVLGYVTSADALASGGLRAPEEEELETAPAPRARAAGGRSAGHAA
jgi:CBS domain-containing protein